MNILKLFPSFTVTTAIGALSFPLKSQHWDYINIQMQRQFLAHRVLNLRAQQSDCSDCSSFPCSLHPCHQILSLQILRPGITCGCWEIHSVSMCDSEILWHSILSYLDFLRIICLYGFFLLLFSLYIHKYLDFYALIHFCCTGEN